MAILHLYNGGEDANPRCVGKMYPRPAPCPDDRIDRIATEKFSGKAWVSRKINTCDCTFKEALQEVKGEECPTLEVGDLIGMVVAPACTIYSGVAYHVYQGVEGVEFDIIRADVDCTDDGDNAVTIAAGISADPPAGPTTPPEPCERLPWSEICADCGAPGDCGFYPSLGDVDVVVPLPAPPQTITIQVPTPEMLQTPAYFYIRIAALPNDFDCYRCCLEIMLSVGLDETRKGN